MLDLIYYSKMYIGEGGTMATEAALLGTPSIHINPLANRVGLHQELKKEYQLKFDFPTFKLALPKILELLEKTDLKATWNKRRKKIMTEKIDVTKFMIWMIDNYPKSMDVINEYNKKIDVNFSFKYKF